MLYHISLDPIENLSPRIPKIVLKGENKTIARICFSKSIDGALTALPYNMKLLLGLKELESRIKIPPILYIYSIEEKSIKRENLVKNRVLIKKGLVKDAHLTDEVWVLEKLSNLQCEVVKLDNFYLDRGKVEGKNYIWKIFDASFKKADEESIKRNLEFWDSVYADFQKKLLHHDYLELKRQVLVNLYEK